MSLLQLQTMLWGPLGFSELTSRRLFSVKGWMAAMLCLAKCSLGWTLSAKLKRKEGRVGSPKVKLLYLTVVKWLCDRPSLLNFSMEMIICPIFVLSVLFHIHSVWYMVCRKTTLIPYCNLQWSLTDSSLVIALLFLE